MSSINANHSGPLKPNRANDDWLEILSSVSSVQKAARANPVSISPISPFDATLPFCVALGPDATSLSAFDEVLVIFKKLEAGRYSVFPDDLRQLHTVLHQEGFKVSSSSFSKPWDPLWTLFEKHRGEVPAAATERGVFSILRSAQFAKLLIHVLSAYEDHYFHHALAYKNLVDGYNSRANPLHANESVGSSYSTPLNTSRHANDDSKSNSEIGDPFVLDQTMQHRMSVIDDDTSLFSTIDRNSFAKEAPDFLQKCLDEVTLRCFRLVSAATKKPRGSRTESAWLDNLQRTMVVMSSAVDFILVCTSKDSWPVVYPRPRMVDRDFLA